MIRKTRIRKKKDQGRKKSRKRAKDEDKEYDMIRRKKASEVERYQSDKTAKTRQNQAESKPGFDLDIKDPNSNKIARTKQNEGKSEGGFDLGPCVTPDKVYDKKDKDSKNEENKEKRRTRIRIKDKDKQGLPHVRVVRFKLGGRGGERLLVLEILTLESLEWVATSAGDAGRWPAAPDGDRGWSEADRLSTLVLEVVRATAPYGSRSQKAQITSHKSPIDSRTCTPVRATAPNGSRSKKRCLGRSRLPQMHGNLGPRGCESDGSLWEPLSEGPDHIAQITSDDTSSLIEHTVMCRRT
ncbi:hypothetical protein DFH29DRAFT_881398 [Suillus ampliporus]|nr:hypothetical protein DFH29DRAFT_881398 [Suillus ampliporus]